MIAGEHASHGDPLTSLVKFESSSLRLAAAGPRGNPTCLPQTPAGATGSLTDRDTAAPTLTNVHDRSIGHGH
jgi:hypothetical protein